MSYHTFFQHTNRCWEDLDVDEKVNIKSGLREILCEVSDWIELAQVEFSDRLQTYLNQARTEEDVLKYNGV
jgi:hypothetical protein